MSAFEIACPDCGASFEVDDEFRGQQADCPACESLFLIPMEGTTAQKLSTDGMFEVKCPKCGEGFEVPSEYRGEQADCTECGTLFTIPPTGDVGIEVSAEPAAAPAAPSPAAPAAAAGGSGIQESELDQSYKKSGTVRLSRAAILENVMKPVLKEELEKKGIKPKPKAPPGARRRPPAGAPGSVSRPPTPSAPATPPASGGAPAAAPAPTPRRERKPTKKITLPPWAPDLRLSKRETVLDYQPCDKSGLAGHIVLTLLPVILIPIAVFVTGALPAFLSALAFMAIGGIVWAIYAFVMLPGLCKRGLVVTTKRAILIDESGIESIEIEE